jgi:hypothetical protein
MLQFFGVFRVRLASTPAPLRWRCESRGSAVLAHPSLMLTPRSTRPVAGMGGERAFGARCRGKRSAARSWMTIRPGAALARVPRDGGGEPERRFALGACGGTVAGSVAIAGIRAGLALGGLRCRRGRRSTVIVNSGRWSNASPLGGCGTKEVRGARKGNAIVAVRCRRPQ